ncbi:MAG: DUF4286 family protein [Bacteroidia bacterium]|nr:DUF4286 family protein [Bacteroidia bacterium]
MFYYNVTCHADKSVEESWVQWMTNIHIPEVMQTGCFLECKMLKLISHDHIDNATTYAIQYLYKTPEHFEKYLQQFAEGLREKTIKEFGNTVHAFRTQLQILEQF